MANPLNRPVVVGLMTVLMLSFLISTATAQTTPTVDIEGHAAPGSTVKFHLKHLPDANQDYLFLMGISGDRPGVPVGDGRVVPVNWDNVVQHSIFFPSQLGLQNTIGKLDSKGEATVTWNIPAFPFLKGVKFYVAYITTNPGRPLPTYVKNISHSLVVEVRDKDTTPPRVSFVTPTPQDKLLTNTARQVIKVSHRETNPDELIFTVDGKTARRQSYSGLSTQFPHTFSEGTHSYLVEVTDTSAHSAKTTTRTITIDTTDPLLSLIIDNKDPVFGKDDVKITWSARDLHLSQQQVTVLSPTRQKIAVSTNPSIPLVVTSSQLTEKGTYTVTVTALDRAGNRNQIQDTFTVNDKTPPVITIISPTNTFYNTKTIMLDASANKQIQSWKYSLNGAANVSFTPATTIVAAEGQNSLQVFATDTSGNEGVQSVSFSVDTINPVLTYTVPTPADNIFTAQKTHTITVQHTEANPDTLVFYKDNAQVYITSYTGSSTQTDLTFAEGQHTFYVTANDTVGHATQTPTRTITIDTIKPSLAVAIDNRNPALGVDTVTIDWNATDANLDTTQANVTAPDNALVIQSTNPQNDIVITPTQLTKSGQYTITLLAEDKAGNTHSIQDTFTVIDTSPPIVTITSPISSAIYNTRSIQLAATANKAINEWKYALNSGPNTTFTPPTTITTQEGSNTVVVYAKDSLGKEGKDEVTFSVDTIAPTISFTSPTPDDNTYTQSRTLRVRVTHAETNPDTVVLYVDGAMTDMISPFINGDSTLEATSLSEGTHTFYVFINDTAGNINQTETRTLYIDNTEPSLTSTSPKNETINSSSGKIDFVLTSNEPLLEANYSLNGGTEEPLAENTATTWESLAVNNPALAKGQHSITFTGKDRAGNIKQITTIFTIYRKTTCTSITDCNNKLEGTYNEVALTQSITNHVGTAITFTSDNVIFDGGKSNSIVIDGDNTGSNDYGIDLNGKSNNVVQNVEVKEFATGIGSSNGNNNKITNSLIHFNTVDGIFLGRNDNPIIIGNTIRDNSNIGITLTSINDIKKGSIQNNIIRANTHGGINIAGNANGLVINDNSIIGNGISSGDYGLIFLHSTSNNNLIYHNNFISNFQQATDNGNNNWSASYPTGGNYWNDYSPTSSKCTDLYNGTAQTSGSPDGICDSSYTTGVTDKYPYQDQDGW